MKTKKGQKEKPDNVGKLEEFKHAIQEEQEAWKKLFKNLEKLKSSKKEK